MRCENCGHNNLNITEWARRINTGEITKEYAEAKRMLKEAQNFVKTAKARYIIAKGQHEEREKKERRGEE